jgi:hypothetical protein
MSAHIEDLKARLDKLKGKPPAGLVDTAELKAQVHKDLEGFAKELFKDFPKAYTNVKGTYCYVPNIVPGVKEGIMSLTTGAFFAGGSICRTKDVIGLWMMIRDVTFPEALRDIKRWLCTSGSVASQKSRKLLKEQREKEERRKFGEIIFGDGEDVIFDSASGILERLNDWLTVKSFTALLREWEKENGRAFHRGHLIVVEKFIGRPRENKGGKSKFFLIRANSESALKWASAEADRKCKEEEERYQASLPK